MRLLSDVKIGTLILLKVVYCDESITWVLTTLYHATNLVLPTLGSVAVWNDFDTKNAAFYDVAINFVSQAHAGEPWINYNYQKSLECVFTKQKLFGNVCKGSPITYSRINLSKKKSSTFTWKNPDNND